jgi:hypothetical protein
MQQWYFICNLVNKEAIAKSSQSAIAATTNACVCPPCQYRKYKKKKKKKQKQSKRE